MKKTVYSLIAAALSAVPAMAVDIYIVGSNINGVDAWGAISENMMTEISTNVYEWTGEILGSGFKFNNGSWEESTYNIGSNGNKIYCYGFEEPSVFTFDVLRDNDSQNIEFGDFDYIKDPKVTLDLNNNKLQFVGTPMKNEGAPEVTFYMIGSNVNGKNWSLAEPDAAFTDMGNGIYEWRGDVLGTGFKINDGTWDNGEYNIGADSYLSIRFGEPFYYYASPSSNNISFDSFTEVINPVVELNTNDRTITLTGGDAVGSYSWYIVGLNDNWDFTEHLYEISSGVYQADVYINETRGTFKISDDGWSHQYGNLYSEIIYPYNMTVDLEQTGAEGNIPYYLPEGMYKVIVNLNIYTVTFEEIYTSIPIQCWVGDNTNRSYFTDYKDNGVFLLDRVYSPENTLKDGIYVITQQGDVVKFYGVDEEKAISLNTPYPLVEKDSWDIPEILIPFDGFDLLADPRILVNLNDFTVTILYGHEYLAGTYNEEDYEPLYIVSSNVNGVSVTSPAEDNQLTSLGRGLYSWVGTQLASGFKIVNANGDAKYTIGDMGNLNNLVLDINFDVCIGKNVEGITINDCDLITDPSLILDLNKLQLLLSSSTAGVENMDTEDDLNAVYYDMHGIRINNPQKGEIYIKVLSNGNVAKVVK